MVFSLLMGLSAAFAAPLQVEVQYHGFYRSYQIESTGAVSDAWPELGSLLPRSDRKAGALRVDITTRELESAYEVTVRLVTTSKRGEETIECQPTLTVPKEAPIGLFRSGGQLTLQEVRGSVGFDRVRIDVRPAGEGNADAG